MSLKQQSEALTREQFEELVNQHQRGLLALAQRICHNHATAEDLVQDSLLQAWQKLHSFNPGTNFIGWVSTILLNRYRDKLRSAKRKPREVSLDSCTLPPVEIDLLPEDDFVAEFLSTLPDIQRVVMEKKVLEEMTVAEIAKELGMKKQAVRSAMFRARNTARKRLEHVG